MNKKHPAEATREALSFSDVEKVAEALQREHETEILEGRKRQPVHSNRASLLAHPCDAYLYYWRTAWEEATPLPLEAIERMGVGTEAEPHILDHCEILARRIGAGVIRHHDTAYDEKLKMSGRVDALLKLNKENKLGLPAGGKMVLEVKTVSPNLWGDVQDLEGLKQNRWTAKYWAQVTVYMYLTGIEHGIFALRSLSGRFRPLPFTIDYAYAEQLLQKTERINQAVEAKEPPEKIARPDVCRDCPFLATACRPPLKYGPGAEFADEPELIRALERRQELLEKTKGCEDDHKEFKKVDKKVKATVKSATEKSGTDTLIVGGWLLERDVRPRKGYWVKDGQTVKVKIKPLEHGE